MKRRTFRHLRPDHRPRPESAPLPRVHSPPPTAAHHHHVYVVLLDSAVARLRRVRAANPKADSKMPCVYVGMSGLSPVERFANHRRGDKASSVVRRYGIRLLPELYAHLNPMPFEGAAEMERDVAEDLRRSGYTVTGGH